MHDYWTDIFRGVDQATFQAPATTLSDVNQDSRTMRQCKTLIIWQRMFVQADFSQHPAYHPEHESILIMITAQFPLRTIRKSCHDNAPCQHNQNARDNSP